MTEKDTKTERQRHTHTHTKIQTDRQRQTDKDRDRHTKTETDRQTDTQRHRQTDTQRQRQTERDIRKSGETGLVDGDGLAGGVQLHPGRVFRRVLHDTDIACGAQTNKNTLNIVHSYTTLHLSRHASYQKKQRQPQRLFCTLKCLKWVYPSVAHTGRFTLGLQISRWGGWGVRGDGGWGATMRFR